MSFVWFEQLPNVLKKAIYEKKIAYFAQKQRENELFSYASYIEKYFWLRIYMPWGTLTMNFVRFEQLPNILKKLYMKKVKLLISYDNNERTNCSSTQARSEIIFGLESTCHEEQ